MFTKLKFVLINNLPSSVEPYQFSLHLFQYYLHLKPSFRFKFKYMIDSLDSSDDDSKKYIFFFSSLTKFIINSNHSKIYKFLDIEERKSEYK